MTLRTEASDAVYTASAKGSGPGSSTLDNDHSRRCKTIAIQTKTGSLRDEVSSTHSASSSRINAEARSARFSFDSESLIDRWDADGGIFPISELDQMIPKPKFTYVFSNAISNILVLIEIYSSTFWHIHTRVPRLLPGTHQSLFEQYRIIISKTFLEIFFDFETAAGVC